MGKPVSLQMINHPLEVVDSLYQQATDLQKQDGSDFGVNAQFEQGLREIGVSQIPSLETVKVDRLAPNSLVRFRGMVQDMYNPEYYLGAYTTEAAPGVWRTTKYRECSQEALGTIAETKLWERKVYYCVPVPGESTWARSSRGGNTTDATSTSSGSNVSKRGREDESSMQQADVAMDAAEPAGVAEGGVKMQHTAEEPAPVASAEASGRETHTHELNLPVAEEDVAPCIVKFYGTEDLRLNEVVDFVGILCANP
eukprot:CAMPEP_0118954822 /NCGR_PEP_ID=MMETSP1169-20130426/58952_1 /TAXON_ID=36882 /ORGANISM="Pyramimonas obovata, Strain CCMP722" /LENGTH=253 /DNA_ID=CAMNT_0006902521 /DNA_START=74 /DNA_END=831 /DNA_ORIENTATION=-